MIRHQIIANCGMQGKGIDASMKCQQLPFDFAFGSVSSRKLKKRAHSAAGWVKMVNTMFSVFPAEREVGKAGKQVVACGSSINNNCVVTKMEKEGCLACAEAEEEMVEVKEVPSE